MAVCNPQVTKPLTTWVSGTVTVGTSAVQIPSSEMTNRKLLILYNGSTADMYIGSSEVTTSTGTLLAVGATMSIDSGSSTYAICGSTNKTLNYLEGK